MDILGLKLNKIRLFIKSKKRRALIRFNNKLEESMFIRLELIKSALKPDSLLGLI